MFPLLLHKTEKATTNQNVAILIGYILVRRRFLGFGYILFRISQWNIFGYIFVNPKKNVAIPKKM